MHQSPEETPDVERVLMDRARRLAERHGERVERPVLPRLVGLLLAVVVVVVVLFAFDRFLASMQRFLGLPVVDPAGAAPETIPAYVVPADPPADGEPRDGPDSTTGPEPGPTETGSRGETG